MCTPSISSPHTTGPPTRLDHALNQSSSFLGNPPASLMKIKSSGFVNAPAAPALTSSPSNAHSPWILFASAFSKLSTVNYLLICSPVRSGYSRFLEYNTRSLGVLLDKKLISDCSRFIRFDVLHQLLTMLHNLPYAWATFSVSLSAWESPTSSSFPGAG